MDQYAISRITSRWQVGAAFRPRRGAKQARRIEGRAARFSARTRTKHDPSVDRLVHSCFSRPGRAGMRPAPDSNSETSRTSYAGRKTVIAGAIAALPG